MGGGANEEATIEVEREADSNMVTRYILLPSLGEYVKLWSPKAYLAFECSLSE